jgi:hypothetical protein
MPTALTVDFKTNRTCPGLFMFAVILVLISSCTGNTNPPSKKIADTANTLQRDTVPVCNYRDSVFGEYLECMKTAKSVSLLCKASYFKEFYNNKGEYEDVKEVIEPFAFTDDPEQIRQIIESFPFRKEYPKDSLIETIQLIEHSEYYFVCEQETLVSFHRALSSRNQIYYKGTNYLVNDSIIDELLNPILINKKRRTKKG